jgi:hypothetical protein
MLGFVYAQAARRMVRCAVAVELGLVQLVPIAEETSNQYVPVARLPLVQEAPVTFVAATV